MFWLIFSIALWGVIHSIMASFRFKAFLRRVLGNRIYKYYRLLYNVFSVFSFVPILYLMIVIPDEGLYQIPAPWRYLMFMGQGLSVMMLFISVMQTGVFAFVGLQQIFNGETNGDLVTSGPYHYIRHPLYTFGLLILWLSPNETVNSFVVYNSLTIYIIVGAYFEEKKLLREFEDKYAEYMENTPMFVPELKFSGNK
jgi:protein-S-isoprenylcysteine O-methyltransferase Ste14